MKRKPTKPSQYGLVGGCPLWYARGTTCAITGREGADQQDRGFVFAFVHINSLPCFCHRWHCLAVGLCLVPAAFVTRAGALAPVPELWGSSSAAPCDPLLPGSPAQLPLAARSPSTAFLCQTWAICAIHSPCPGVAKAGDSSSLSCGPLCSTTHLQWGIPPEMYGNVSPCHECLTSNLRGRASLRTCLVWLKQSPWWQSISAL